jgi:hypothetical protein
MFNSMSSNPQALRPVDVAAFAAIRRHLGLVLLFLALLAAVFFINPIREMVTEDDGFAYARTVQHLLETGEYRLDSWSAANMPTQIFFATGLAKVFGYSSGVLVVSTLIMLAFSLCVFYLFLRDFGLDDRLAALFTLGLFCSPPVLLLGFTFMTEVHFIAWMLAATWLYAGAIRRRIPWLMLLASIPAAAAIGTRQFGLALLGGLVLTWLLFERRFRTVPFFLLGMPVPLAAAFWQIRAGMSEPNFTQLVRLGEQSLYLNQGFVPLLGEFIWRPVMFLEYIGIFIVPLLPVSLFLVYAVTKGRESKGAEVRHARDTPRLHRRLLTAWTLLACTGLAYSFLTSEWVDGMVVRSPVLPSTSWLLEYRVVSSAGSNWVRYPLTLFAILSAIGLGWLLTLRYADASYRRGVSPEEGFVVLTGLVLLMLHLVYVQSNDTYAVAFLPLVLFVLAQLLRGHRLPRWGVRTASASCLAFLILSSLVVRSGLERQEAVWTVAEQLRVSGVDPMQIKGDSHWNYYHSAFDLWIDEVGRTGPMERYTRPYGMHSAFYGWLAERQQNARYRIVAHDSPPGCGGCSPGRVAEYRNSLFRRRYVYAVVDVGD